LAKTDFRKYVPAPGASTAYGKSARGHVEERLKSERVQQLFGPWRELYEQPFKGMTTDGNVIPDLFELRPEGAPTEAMINATMALLRMLSPEQKAAMSFSIDSTQWRNWQNTEMYVEDYGLRLAEVPMPVREAVMAVVSASLSRHGLELTRDVMRMNAFLGDLVGGPDVMNEWTYLFNIFGTPSASEPWGWQLFGHHLCLHCFVLGEQMTLTPAFFGAEPTYADEGPFKGIRLFEDKERDGLKLMRSFSNDQQERAIVAHCMVGGDLPPGRRHFADNLNLGGAYQDNRVVPYEGIEASSLSQTQQRDLLSLAEAYLAPLPKGPLTAQMEDVERHLNETHFCWIGGFEENSAFYYRIQSPVVFIEFDHHGGVFLTNPEPANFHVHTIVRTPNGNDYGMDLLRLHYKNAPHHRQEHRHEHKHEHKHAHAHKHSDGDSSG